MSLLETLSRDLKESQIKKEVLKLSVLRLAFAALNNREIEKRTRLSKTESLEKLAELSRLTEEEALEVVAGEAKKRKEAIEAFKKGNRQDLVEKEEKELEILAAYLPASLDETELKEIIKKAVSETNAQSLQDLGKVMAKIMPQVKNRADGNLVNRLVKELLSNS